jgi:hypothetical protein
MFRIIVTMLLAAAIASPASALSPECEKLWFHLISSLATNN